LTPAGLLPSIPPLAPWLFLGCLLYYTPLAALKAENGVGRCTMRSEESTRSCGDTRRFTSHFREQNPPPKTPLCLVEGLGEDLEEKLSPPKNTALLLSAVSPLCLKGKEYNLPG
jgi:hypothetical protein